MYGLELDGGSRAFEVVTRALDRGLLLLPSGDDGQVISLTPPLIMEEQAIDNALDVLIECVRAT
jgi:4-aminobutyrate aminotransferase-like enzyme